MKKLIESCPNCAGTKRRKDKAIKNMPNGDCGVCGGTGLIEWTETGLKLVDYNPTH